MNCQSIKAAKIFYFYPALEKFSQTLMRLSLVDSAISRHPGRGRLIGNLTRIWIEAEDQLKLSFESSKALSLQAIKLLPPSARSIYTSEIDNISEVSFLQKFIQRCLQDAASLLIPPIKRSSRGSKGPTFLINYERQSLRRIPMSHLYVIKWTDRSELNCQRIYAAFCSNFGSLEGTPVTGYLTPKVAALNFDQELYEDSCGQVFPLAGDQSLKLKQRFLTISRIYSERIPETTFLLLAERVEGENLFDFAQTRYQYLNLGHKEKLFNRLGKLAMVDMITGNLDRLVQIFTNAKREYCLWDLEANLGNVMVVWSKESEGPPTLYAIDNGVDIDLVESLPHREKYLQFLTELLSSACWQQKVAKNLVDSFKHALLTQIDDVSDGNVLEITKQLKAFSKDLGEIGLKAFEYGIHEMFFHFTHTLIPGWDSKKSVNLKNYLLKTNPNLLEALSERINLIKRLGKG